MTDEQLAAIEARAQARNVSGANIAREMYDAARDAQQHVNVDADALLAEVKRLRAALPDIFDAGFAESGEGWNNEWPREFNAEQAKRYETARAVAVHEVLKTT